MVPRVRLHRAITCLALVAAALVATAPRADAAWPVPVRSGSSGQSSSTTAPPAPTGVTATCVSVLLSNQVTVSWSAAARASSYTVLDSTTGSAGPYTVIASNVTTTSWVSSLTTATYTFVVQASTGANWISPQSAASNQVTVLLGLACG